MGPAIEPLPGDIGITRLHGETGLLIRIGQYLNGDGFTDYEHAFVYVGGGQIVEAEPGGARLTALTDYDPASVLWLRCPPRYGPGVAHAARALIGTPYCAADYFALALHRLHIPAPGLRDYIAATGHLICSALADRAASLGGWTLFRDRRWDGYVTPADLAGLALHH